MTHRFLFSLLSLVTLALGACSYVPMRPQLVAQPSPVDLRLADAAERSTRALETLASVEQARTPTAGAAILPNVPPELQKAVTFNWNGPAEPLLRSLAAKVGYAFNQIGAVPPTPLIVNVSAKNRPVSDVLRDIGLQLGTRADLRLDASRRVIEVVYPALANPTKG